MGNTKRILSAGFEVNCNPFTRLSLPSDAKSRKTALRKRKEDEPIFHSPIWFNKYPWGINILDPAMLADPEKAGIYAACEEIREEILE